MDKVNKIINTDYARKNGLTGEGINIAIVDTGLYLHGDFDRSRIIGFRDFLNRKYNMYDDCGHGTHVCGIICGNGKMSGGKYMGIAPNASVFILKVLDYRGNGKLSTVNNAMDWLIKNVRKYNIDIINISIGTSLSLKNASQYKLVEKVEKLWDMGVVVCVAAGNNGPEDMTISLPGVSPKVITVGFISENGHYSGRGPTKNCIVKPEIVAPGEDIISCSNTKMGYAMKSGTSMATPIVSGAIALLKEKYPYMSNKDVKKRLYERAVDLGYKKNIQGWGSLDIEKLLC